LHIADDEEEKKEDSVVKEEWSNKGDETATRNASVHWLYNNFHWL